MIDAGPSLRAAEGLSASALLTYLRSAGWSAKPSRVKGITILSKSLPEADEPVELILPVVPGGFGDEQRRVADALRTIEAIEQRPMQIIVDAIRRVAAKHPKGPSGKAMSPTRGKRALPKRKKAS
jgi:hypothetical protein